MIEEAVFDALGVFAEFPGFVSLGFGESVVGHHLVERGVELRAPVLVVRARAVRNVAVLDSDGMDVVGGGGVGVRVADLVLFFGDFGVVADVDASGVVVVGVDDVVREGFVFGANGAVLVVGVDFCEWDAGGHVVSASTLQPTHATHLYFCVFRWCLPPETSQPTPSNTKATATHAQPQTPPPPPTDSSQTQSAHSQPHPHSAPDTPQSSTLPPRSDRTASQTHASHYTIHPRSATARLPYHQSYSGPGALFLRLAVVVPYRNPQPPPT